MKNVFEKDRENDLEKGFLKARVNISNGQINFQLNKRSLPKKFRDKLPNLKGVKIGWKDLKFD